jgi:hypothetical protein
MLVKETTNHQLHFGGGALVLLHQPFLELFDQIVVECQQ